jgi:hypothetical protein
VPVVKVYESYRSKKPDPELDPDPIQKVPDPQHWTVPYKYVGSFVQADSIVLG